MSVTEVINDKDRSETIMIDFNVQLTTQALLRRDTGYQTDRQTDRQTDKQTDRQTDKQADRQKEGVRAVRNRLVSSRILTSGF